MKQIHLVQEYPQSRAVVWKALTEPELVARWTVTGQGGRPEGFRTVVGTKFKLIAKPLMGWDGIVRCEVLEVEEGRLLRYDWRNKPQDQPTMVTNLVEDLPDGGTRLTWDHTDFRGVEGFFMSTVLRRVRRRMLAEGLPAVLKDLDE